MPQQSLSFACGRVGVLRRAALRTAQLERLTSARDYADASRALIDIGFASVDSADFQQAADQHVRKACQLLKAVTPEKLVTDSFLLRYDVHNLKMLYKSRYLAQKPQFLSQCGTLDVEMLRHSVAERSYGRLPAHLKAAMELLEKRSAVRFDPMLVDTELDKAMYRQAFDNLSQSRNAHVCVRYFQAKADITNVIMMLRLKAMGKEATQFGDVALPGGNTAIRVMQGLFTETERLARLLRPYGTALYQAVLAASADAGKLPYLEKVADDYLGGLFRDSRYDTASMEMLIAYLLNRQREATDIRLIMAGKQNGFSPEAVLERVRELSV
jgi:V/A-type H+-transporting ATPase subunit C